MLQSRYKFEDHIDTMLLKFESYLKAFLYKYDIQDKYLRNAIEYTVFSKGKRLRPLMVMSVASVLDVQEKSALNIACAVEFIHSYTLVHDDLPGMDNDDFRRGQATCHIKFDEATAILVGDALQSLAFELLSDEETHDDPAVRCQLVKLLANYIGANGIIRGQMMDIRYPESISSVEDLDLMSQLKTGRLFSASCEPVAIAAKSARNIVGGLRNYGCCLGVIFQIQDDIKDSKILKGNNYISKLTIEEAYSKKFNLMNNLLAQLEFVDDQNDVLKNFVHYMCEDIEIASQ